jgi:tetratricopeptide (TPR) repeat protein
LIKQFITAFFLLGLLVACSSPEEKAAEYVANADALFAEKNLDKAAIEYKNALQVNHNLPDAWFGLARIHERKQEWEQVYATLNKIREMAPNHVDARIKMGQLLLASNQLDQALTDATEILELAPADARAHALMAAVQFRLGNFEAALEEVEQAQAIDPDHAEALLVRARILIAEKRESEALAELDRAIAKHPENVVFYLMKVQALSQQDDIAAIENVYLALVDQFPENASFKQALARYYLEAEDIDAAEQILQQIADTDTDNVDQKIRYVAFKRQYRSIDDAITLAKAYMEQAKDEYRYRFLLGELYENSGQTEQALALYEEIVIDDGLQQNGLEARNKIAVIERRAGNPERARALVSEVLAQDKSNQNALLLQAGLQLADGKTDDAIVTARTALRDNPDSIKALGLLGEAHKANGSTELAIDTYGKAFQLRPGVPAIANQLAELLLRQRKTTQADEVLQKSFENGNRSVAALKLAAQTKLALGEWDKAEQLAVVLQKVEGQEAVSQQLLGAVYQGMEQKDASVEAFKRAHELAPGTSQPIVSVVQTYLRDGKVDEAKSFLQSILKTDENNVTAQLLLGRVSLDEGDNTEAITRFKKVIEIDPGLDTGYQNLAAAYLRQDEFEKAEATLKTGIEAIPDRLALSVSLASLYERRGEFEKAIGIYETVLEKNDQVLVARNNLASLLTDHRSDEASRQRARTISAELKDSPIPQFRDTYAWASTVAKTNLEEAVVILKEIVRENEPVDVYNYHLGEAYRQKGDLENAKTYLTRAVELAEPGSDIAEKAGYSLQLVR